jgi:peptidoglycan/xylan/chitin deacetylase (PgdA/CDA1 family)
MLAFAYPEAPGYRRNMTCAVWGSAHFRQEGRAGLRLQVLGALSLLLLSAACASGEAPRTTAPSQSLAPTTQPAASQSALASASASASAATSAALLRGKGGLPIPAGSATVAVPKGNPTNLKVLNWAGFKGAASYTFDDSNSSQISHYAEIQALRVPMTFYLITGKTESTDPVWGKALLDGHELGNHTESHADTDDGKDTDLATAFIEKTWNTKVWTMAAPYGAAVYSDVAKTRFLINRGVSDALIGANDTTDPFTLPSFGPDEGALTASLDSKVSAARDSGKWQVFLIHGFTGGTDGAYHPFAFEEFTKHVTKAKTYSDVWLDTVVAIGAYWRGQKAFQSVTPTQSGTQTTWTWQLPAHFPPGKYLRVTVDGGTLSQGGSTLTWDPHGYYEVALDQLSLTLSP